jgi:sterol desaturase/sphingolipid hydroxylase (fatty acid hydroxylase superfamily)
MTLPSTIDTVSEILFIAALLLFPFELWRRWNGRQLTKLVFLEIVASMSPLLLVLATTAITTAFVVAVWSFTSALSPWQIETTPLSAVAAILLVDFLYYIDHRAGHRIRLYWAIAHSVHHSSTQYDQSTAFRVSFVDGFLSPFFYVPALLLGFDVLMVASAFGFILLYQQWLHTELIGKLRFLDPWLNTPSNHRVHHATQEIYLDKNYGAVLMIWDRMFGTYQAELEHEPVKYGLTQQINSSNPATVHIAEIVRTWNQLRETWRQSVISRRHGLVSRIRNTVQYLVSPPAVPIDKSFR